MQHCQFGDDLNNSVKDCLVLGVNDTRIQRHLLQETDVTFDKAFEISQSVELTNKELSLLQKDSTPIHRVDKATSRSSPSIICYRCGDNHLCKFHQTKCQTCGKTGHIAMVCLSKPSKTVSRSKFKKSHTMEVTSLSTSLTL